jgi:hypothetical protein
VDGNLGVSPGTAVTGFGPGVVTNGTVHTGDTVAAQAQLDLTGAYGDASGRVAVATLAAELGGTTRTSGVYNSDDDTFGISGTLTLDAQGDPNAVFIFQSATTLITTTGSQVVLANGAQACNVFWQVGSSATLGLSSTFRGTILALTSITVTTGASVEGRVLALNGAVTLDTNSIMLPLAAGQIDLDQGFGYRDVTASSTITGTIWVDADASGVLDAGETNRYAGVTVALLDTNGNVVATMVTDVNGDYTFSGIPDGTFRVNVADYMLELNGTWHTVGTVGANNNSQSDPYTVTLTGPQTADVDFGYYKAGGALGNRVWWDVNRDGLQSSNDVGIIDLKVTLRVSYAAGVTHWVVTRTDTNGAYGFGYLLLDETLPASGAGAPVFVLGASATNAIYTPTLIDVGSNAGTNDWLDSDNHGGVTGRVVRGMVDVGSRPDPADETSAASYDFGYIYKPTLVRLTAFGAVSRDGAVVLRWETAEERGTLGFWLERWVDGEYRRVNATLIPGRIVSLDDTTYEQIDPGALPGGRYTYRLIEVETSGNLMYLGPYAVEVDGATLSFDEWSRAAFDTSALLDSGLSGLDADPDGDGMDNLAEFIAGTDPADSQSALRVTVFRPEHGVVVVGWPSATARVYRIERAASIVTGFEPREMSVPATPPHNTYTDRVEGVRGDLFYKVRVE